MAAFAWLRRHTRWQLLAAAGALAYACTPHRMFQLTSHFNAVMWWAFPAALLAFEVMLERRRAGRPWGWPAAGLAADHPDGGRQRRVPPHPLPDRPARVPGRLDAGGRLAGRKRVPGPLAAVTATLAVACAYVLGVFQAVFKGTVAGENGAGSRSCSTPPARSGRWSARASAPRARG